MFFLSRECVVLVFLEVVDQSGRQMIVISLIQKIFLSVLSTLSTHQTFFLSYDALRCFFTEEDICKTLTHLPGCQTIDWI